MTVVGVLFNICLESKNVPALVKFVGHALHGNVIKAFNMFRVQVGRTVYISMQYVKAKKRNNYTVTFHDGNRIK